VGIPSSDQGLLGIKVGLLLVFSSSDIEIKVLTETYKITTANI
jgi:hypothetical protein